MAFRPGALHIGIVELPLQPAGGADLSSLGRLHAGLEAAAPSGGAHILWPSRAISERNMPSRMPRSATPSVLAGQMSMIASKIAQPATTRSARSWSMHGRQIGRRSCRERGGQYG